MKLTAKIVAGASALAFLTLTAGSLQAQNTLTNVVSISFTATEQDTNITDNGTVTTTAAPMKHSATTPTILGWLAIDEYAEGKYPTNSFPTGAKIIAISSEENAPDIQVVDKHDNYLVDVSDILSITNSGAFGADVESGKQNDANRLYSTKTEQEFSSVVYNDSLSTSNYLFSFGGVILNKTTDTTPNSSGIFKRTESHTITSGQGDGIYMGTQFVITGGSLKASGSGEDLLVAP